MVYYDCGGIRMKKEQTDVPSKKEQEERQAQVQARIFNRQEDCAPPSDSRRGPFFLLVWLFSSIVLVVISCALFSSLDKWYFMVLAVLIGIAAGFVLALGICAVMNIFMPTLFFKSRENHHDCDWRDIDWPYHPDV